MIKTWNFTTNPANAVLSTDGGFDIRDKRTGIESLGTHVTSVYTYLNYLTFLNMKREEWVNTEYFDIGLVPIGYSPALMQPIVNGCAQQLLTNFDIPYNVLPGITIFGNGTSKDLTDIWVRRKDIANKCGMGNTQLAFSVIDFLRKELPPVWNKKIIT